VIAMKDPRQALEAVRRREGSLDLLITDVVMPEMNGRELRDRLREMRPGLRCLFMSGYPADAMAPAGILGEGDELLEKPFTLEAFSRRIAKVLGTAPAAGG
jgi:CheY-like chemotaxis protein